MNNENRRNRDELRLLIMRLIDRDPKLTQRDIAGHLGISLGLVNYCVKALVETGLVKVNNFRRSDSKRGYVYILTPSGVSERALQTKRFLLRKLEEYEKLKAEIIALEAEVGINERCDEESGVTIVK